VQISAVGKHFGKIPRQDSWSACRASKIPRFPKAGHQDLVKILGIFEFTRFYQDFFQRPLFDKKSSNKPINIQNLTKVDSC